MGQSSAAVLSRCQPQQAQHGLQALALAWSLAMMLCCMLCRAMLQHAAQLVRTGSWMWLQQLQC